MASLTDITPVHTWAAAEELTAANFNAQIRDYMSWLRAVSEAAGNTGMYVADDCLFVPGVAGAAPLLAGGVSAATGVGAGAGVTAGTSTNVAPGILAISTGTTSTGAEGLIGPADVIVLGANDLRFECRVGLSALSDGTNRYSVRCGLGDSATAESVDFVGLRYSDNVNGGNWQGVCRSNSVETVVDTGSVGSTTNKTLAFTVNSAATSVQFYAAGSAAGSPITTNIPSGSARSLTFMPAMILKSLGGTARSVNLDFYSYLMSVAR